MNDQRHLFFYPEKLVPGNKVAILSPSGGLPEIFPDVFNLGLQRIKAIFGLEPVEYPTTRILHSSMEERAKDVHDAFADPKIKAIICSIGGEDQIRLLKHLDSELIRSHPKVFLGYSDATNLEMYLWNLGLVSFYGGSVMVQFGMSGAMHDYTVESLKRVLFERGEFELKPSKEYSDETFNWAETDKLTESIPMFPNEGWKWINEGMAVEGITWGGCLEIIDWNLRANKFILPNDLYKDKILFFETSEEIPDASYVYRVLVGMGERGILENFAAVLVGRPKAWVFSKRMTWEEKEVYKREQEEAILRALEEYNPGVLTVFNMDFGHTDPQCIVPYGGYVRIDGINKQIFARY